MPDYSTPENNKSHYTLWNFLNFTTVALITNAAVLMVQSPIKTIVLTLSKNNTIPAYNGGILGFTRALYAGTQASLSSSALRTTYVTNTKTNQSGDVTTEEVAVKARFASSYVPIAALGEVLITQIPNALADHKKAGIVPKLFKWYTPHNLLQLMKGNLGIKYMGAVINCYSLCILEQRYAQWLSLNSESGHFITGALSGLSAAVCNYPLAVFTDYTQVRAHVAGGRLVNKGSICTLRELYQLYKANPRASTGLFFRNAQKQLPLRLTSAAAVFSIISGMSESLGPEPLQDMLPSHYTALLKGIPVFFKPAAQEAPAELAKAKPLV